MQYDDMGIFHPAMADQLSQQPTQAEKKLQGIHPDSGYCLLECICSAMLESSKADCLSENSIQQFYRLGLAMGLFQPADVASHIRRLISTLHKQRRNQQADKLAELALAIDPMFEGDIPLNQQIRDARSRRLASNAYYQYKNGFADDD
ncbi:hypothetical protein [Gallibacterium anatis]|uniref:hypothetical protein n=1 Tax=Gallibacterium anatis TaxID=750 RepID=UPI002549EFC4|nr:hypothetical protein [Gallibacterium anatis]WIM82950.1 hypothetical protein QP019_04680 [Gallibacterium anatis]